MSLTSLAPEEARRLRREPLTYPEVGGTRADTPAGYAGIRRSRPVAGGVPFEAAADAVLTWQVQSRSGLAVAASAPRAAPDEVVLMRIGLGPVAVRIPCRVVYVVDEPDRQGFAYGTLPGHPETGEESFVVERGPDGPVLTITAFSRAATRLARLGGPVAAGIQRVMTTRYLRTLDG